MVGKYVLGQENHNAKTFGNHCTSVKTGEATEKGNLTILVADLILKYKGILKLVSFCKRCVFEIVKNRSMWVDG